MLWEYFIKYHSSEHEQCLQNGIEIFFMWLSAAQKMLFRKLKNIFCENWKAFSHADFFKWWNSKDCLSYTRMIYVLTRFQLSSRMDRTEEETRVRTFLIRWLISWCLKVSHNITESSWYHFMLSLSEVVQSNNNFSCSTRN